MSLLQGEFRVEDGCAYIRAERDSEAGEPPYYLPLFPREEAQLVDGNALEYQGSTYQDGDHIELSGGGPNLSLEEALDNGDLPENISIGERCRDEAHVFVVAPREI
ncbi:hypothetical protein [Nesterenkonia populi]